MHGPEIDNTQKGQMYMIACKSTLQNTHYTYMYKCSMCYTLMIIIFCMKGNNSQFQIHKFNRLFIKKWYE